MSVPTLRDILYKADLTRCWWGIFAGKARCQRHGVYRKPWPDGRYKDKDEQRLTTGAVWCEQHRHVGDILIRQVHV